MAPTVPPPQRRGIWVQAKNQRARLVRAIRKAPSGAKSLVRLIFAGMRRLSGKTRLLVQRIWPSVKRTLPLVIGVGGVAAMVWAIARLHSVMRSSPDAWASAIGAVTTVALVLITAWYAYVTYRMLDAQRSAPRAVA